MYVVPSWNTLHTHPAGKRGWGHMCYQRDQACDLQAIPGRTWSPATMAPNRCSRQHFRLSFRCSLSWKHSGMKTHTHTQIVWSVGVTSAMQTWHKHTTTANGWSSCASVYKQNERMHSHTFICSDSVTCMHTHTELNEICRGDKIHRHTQACGRSACNLWVMVAPVIH